MKEFSLIHSKRTSILALGAESAGVFSAWKNGELFISDDFGDLLDAHNFQAFEKEVTKFITRFKFRPEIIICDLHPDFRTTELAQKISNKHTAGLVQVQHHIAHIFSALADEIIYSKSHFLSTRNFIGIGCDGTGLGTDGKIWGGEIFEVESQKSKVYKVSRIGHLENQIMIGGQKAIEEPARILLAVASKFNNNQLRRKVFEILKQYYSVNEISVLKKQLNQKFNCIETSSTARVLDAVSLLLGFCKNDRGYKHKSVNLLEDNSSEPLHDLKPLINVANNKTQRLLNTTYLFEYLIKNLHKDKKRLAATAQLYIAMGIYEITTGSQIRKPTSKIYFAGGMANNKIISDYLVSKGVYIAKKLPCGDAGLSVGQIAYYLLTNTRN